MARPLARRCLAALVLLVALALAGLGDWTTTGPHTLAATPAATPSDATASDLNKETVLAVYAIFSGGDPGATPGVIAPSWTNHAPAFAWLPTGLDGFGQLVGFFRTAFPDLRITVEDLVSEGELVAARYTIRGTHLGPLGDIPATGKPVEIQAMDLFGLANGQVTDVWLVVDQLALLTQIGVLPSAEATPAP